MIILFVVVFHFFGTVKENLFHFLGNNGFNLFEFSVTFREGILEKKNFREENLLIKLQNSEI